MNKELKEQARKDFRNKFKGWILQDENETYRSFEIIEAFQDSLIDKTVQMTEERIVEMIRAKQKSLRFRNLGKGRVDFELGLEQAISLITNKNDINK